MSLSDEEFETVQTLLSADTIHHAAAVRLYISNGDRWEYSGVTGAAAIVTDGNNDGYFIRIVDVDNSSVVFEQELYNHFKYGIPMPFFHVFEYIDGIAGLSFADEAESQEFYSHVLVAAEELKGGAWTDCPTTPQGGGALSGGAAPPRASPAAHSYTPAPQSYEEEDEDEAEPSPPQSHYVPPPQVPLSAPPAMPPPTPPVSGGGDAIQSNPTLAAMKATPIPQANRQQAQASASQNKKIQQQKTSKSGGFFSRFKKGKSKSEEVAMEISGPTDFKHESHIGWDRDTGFDIRNIPPEWRKLFQAAGVKKSDLKNEETAQFIVDTVVKTLAVTQASMPPQHQASSKAAAPPPPPMAPPPPAAPPPPGAPPMPAPAAAEPASGTGGLLAQLGSVQLKKKEERVEQDSSLPSLDGLQGGAGQSLVDTLAKAMQSRRGVMSEAADEDEDDEWSEDEEEWD